MPLSKHDTLTQNWVKAGLKSKTVVQLTSIESASHVACVGSPLGP